MEQVLKVAISTEDEGTGHHQQSATADKPLRSQR